MHVGLKTEYVPALRLAYENGDIPASYSGDVISIGKSIRKPFRFAGALWCCVSVCGRGIDGHGTCEAYRLESPELFQGQATTYREKINRENGSEEARSDPNGFHHGMKVSHGKQTLVLCGPPIAFVAQAEAKETPAEVPIGSQLSMF
jgi:hypothetical protein